MKQISGPIFLTGDHTSSEHILGSAYLSFDLEDPDQRRILGTYAFADSLEPGRPEFIGPTDRTSRFRIIMAGDGFGKGSSRRHAIVALGEAGIQVVVARSFGDGFYRACVNEGCTLPLHAPSIPDDLLDERTGLIGRVDLDRLSIEIEGTNWNVPFDDPGIALDIHSRGGLAFTRQTE